MPARESSVAFAQQGVAATPFRDGIFVESAAADGLPRLIGSACGSCGAVAFPRLSVCPSCSAVEEIADRLLGPYGTLYTFAVVRQAPAPFEAPYAVGYVDLDDGPRAFGHVELGEEEPRAGERMQLSVGRLYARADGSEVVTYKFRRAEPEAEES